MVAVKNKMLRIFTIIGVALLTTSVLLGVNLVYNRVFYTNPLEAAVRKMPAVGEFKIEKLNSKSRIRVQFNVKERLRSSFYQLLDQLENQNLQETQHFTLEISNQAEENLYSFLLAARLPVQEALSTGEFTALPDSLKLPAAEYKVKFDLEVDNHFIFLTASNDSGSAHLIINRGSSPLNIVTTMGGEYL